MSSNLPAKRHPDSARSVAAVDNLYHDIVDGFKTLDELSESDPRVASVILAQNSALAKIYQEYRSAVGRNDVMNATVDAQNITIEELREEANELKRLEGLHEDQILTPRQNERRKERQRGKRNTAVWNAVSSAAGQSARR